MNVEQLLLEIEAFTKALSDGQIIKTFGEFNTALEQVIGNPGNVDIQKKFQSARGALFSKLDSLKTWDEESEFELTKEFPERFVIGPNLRAFIETTLTENAVTPALALDTLRKRHSQLEGFIKQLNALKTSAYTIGFSPPQLSPGECTARVTLPIEYVKGHLAGVGIEINSIDKMLKLFSTVFEGARLDFQIVQLSSSKPKFQIKLNWKTALGVLVAIKFTLELLNNVVDIRLKYEELLKLGVQSELVGTVDRIVESRVNNGLKQIKEQILAENSQRNGGGAPAEIDKTLEEALKLLLDKIQHGVTFNIVALPPQNTEGAEKDSETFKAYQKINDLNVEVKKLRAPTQPVISLPGPNEPSEPSE